jgi:hypothetical protein
VSVSWSRMCLGLDKDRCGQTKPEKTHNGHDQSCWSRIPQYPSLSLMAPHRGDSYRTPL